MKEDWNKWRKHITKEYKQNPEETQWIHLSSSGYVIHMLHHNGTTKYWGTNQFYVVYARKMKMITNIFDECIQ